MKTTHIFVELLITGFGVVIWLVMAIAALLGLNLNDILSKVDIVTFAPIAGLAYVFGIIVDRIGYELFSIKSDKLMTKFVGPTNTHYNTNQETGNCVNWSYLSGRFVILFVEEIKISN